MKKSKQLFGIPLAIIALIILLLGLTNKPIQGTWLGTYCEYPEVALFMANERIITFNNFNSLEQAPHYELTKERKGYFSTLLNFIKTDHQYYIIKSLEEDQLILKAKKYDPAYRTFIKLHDSLKNMQPITLTGKKFLFTRDSFSDTLFFKTANTAERSNFPNSFQWKELQHNGFQVLFMEEAVPLLITKQHGTYIELKNMTQPNQKITLKAL